MSNQSWFDLVDEVSQRGTATDSEKAQQMKRTCKSCGALCDGTASITLAGRTDFYCHPSWSVGHTCYSIAQSTLRAACASVGIEHGKTTDEMMATVLGSDDD